MRALRLHRLIASLLLVWPLSGAGAAPALLRPLDVPAGLTLDDVAALLEDKGVAPAQAVLEQARDPHLAHGLGLPADSLEGYIQPGSYLLPPSASIEDALRMLVAGHRGHFTDAQRDRARSMGLTEHQVIILASLVEKTASAAAERSLVAGMLRRRLAAGWHLDSEAGLIRALAMAGRDRSGGLDRLDYRRDLPANPFRQIGLPPEPICSPSPEAVVAVLQSADAASPVLFRDPDGRLRFDLPAEERQALAGVRADPPPPETTRGLHYVVSNEVEPFRFKPAVERLGGVHIGVGAEQNYLLAGWSRPALLILMDFDQVIVDLHDVYRVAFLNSDSPEAFTAMWQRRKRREFRKLIAQAYPDRRRRTRALNAFRMSRRAVVVRLGKLAETFGRIGEKYFLNDPEQYAHLAALFRADRVLAIRGDLTARRTMRDLSRVLRAHGRVLRTLYLSNAEQYFPYDRAFRKNITAQPTDRWSVVLRTRPTRLDYTYVLQWYDNFRRWLDVPAVRNVRRLAPRRVLSPRRPLLQIVAEPPARRVPTRAKAKRVKAGQGKKRRSGATRRPRGGSAGQR